MAIDGSKYYYWRGKFIATGSLRAFDLMTRHYEAGNFADYAPPVGRRRKTWIATIDPGVADGGIVLSDATTVVFEHKIPEPVIFTPFKQGPVTYQFPPKGWLVQQYHVHRDDGICIKNRYGPRCLTRKEKGLETVSMEGDIL